MPESVRRKVVWDWGDWERGLWVLSLLEGLAEAHGRLGRASGGHTVSGSAFTEPRDRAGKGGGGGRGGTGAAGLVKVYIDQKEWNLRQVLTLEPKRRKGL